jgi:hypothetical protein
LPDGPGEGAAGGAASKRASTSLAEFMTRSGERMA